MRNSVDCRRGVLMLMVLILLSLFVLMVLAYILLASESATLAIGSTSDSSESSNPITQSRDDFDLSARQVLRGHNVPWSALTTHSLLEDMWGHEDTRAFSGTGVASDDDANGVPYALQPHPRGWLTGASFDELDSGFEASLTSGKMDEDYDAADYRNMVLGMVDEGGVIIPSLHRPALVRYMQTQHASRWGDANDPLKRRVLFRPLTEDNPDFDG
ncbi:MAG: hypothetical protein MI757_10035, partial [Pirellulales bacterium]|nr:hypothetical protein [Pirellulales bacterium]